MSIEVIGAGWGRTGTSSFKKALEILGYDPTYHMVEVFKNSDAKFWNRAYEGEKMDFEQVFNRPGRKYKASCDLPSSNFWEEQLKQYPDAKVILTKRDPEKWYKSCCDTVFCMSPNYPGCSLGAKVMMMLGIPTPNFYQLSCKIWAIPGFDEDFSKENAIRAYNAHVENVMNRCPPEKLLVFDVAEGWGPLCKFLNKPIPNEPFPHVNDTNEFRKIVNGMTLAGNTVLFVSATVLVGLAAYAYQRYLQ